MGKQTESHVAKTCLPCFAGLLVRGKKIQLCLANVEIGNVAIFGYFGRHQVAVKARVLE